MFYVGIGAGTFLVVRLTEDEKGELDYNTSIAVLLTECCKLVVAGGFAWRAGEHTRATSWSSWCKYGAPALIYAIQNNLNIHGISYLSAPVFTLFNNSKILFSALFATLLLRQKFSMTQWFALCLLIVSLCVAKLPLLMKALDNLTAGSQADADLYRFLIGLLLVLVARFVSHLPKHSCPPCALRICAREQAASAAALAPAKMEVVGAKCEAALDVLTPRSFSFTSGLAGSVNEFLLKNTDAGVGFFTKSLWTYQWGVLLNLIAILQPLITKQVQAGGSAGSLAALSRLTHGFDKAGVWVMIAVNACNGLTVGLILKHFDNIAKCFGNVLMVYLVTLCTYVFVADAHKNIDRGLLLGIALYAVSTYCYTAYPLPACKAPARRS